MQLTSKITATLVALASAANAHMIMKTPTPFNTPDSSPILTDGSNFPCKIAGGSGDVKSGPANVMTVGQTNSLSFTGGATHGGGSCQVSMAKGTSVNQNTKWMVIYSIEGNCPIEGSTNLSGDPNDSGSMKFDFAVPDHPDLPAGDYTLAWTWNNKIGNREFYMNCAYVQLQGAKKKRYEPSRPVKKDQTPLPDMFVANIPQGNGCTVAETTDVLYPNPGDPSRVIKGTTGGPYNFQPPSGNCGAAANNAAPASSAAASPAASSAAAATSSVATNAVSPVSSARASAAASGSRTANPGIFATVATSGAASQATSGAVSQATSAAASQTTAAVVTSAVVTSATKASSAAVATGTGTGSTTLTGSQSGPCTNEGAWACSADGKAFQRCASGEWSVAMPMAAGMTCTPGISANFAYNVSGGVKRDIRSHISRRRHSLQGVALS
ncbi:hypothetical protein H2198_002178 [Neophaeococcomyces mojaviensis]|uniref:Uncharacterized protein n=1 Tax=Neophaeococcomyces mojaviensis TaxID=3383035 RepID=A0ACC3AES5_9EURO|nr:hypothetical protein H2198_002178 [Knufia sp. JES_112]